MTAEEITQYLTELNDELCLMDIKGEVSLYGGAVMCLAFKARPATKDVDAIFEPVREIRRAAQIISDRHNLRKDWMNLAVKIFIVEHDKKVFINFPNLRVMIPAPDYLFAMKVLAGRSETEDLKDIRFLLNHLQITSVDQALEIVKNYYPKKEVKPATKIFLEEVIDEV